MDQEYFIMTIPNEKQTFASFQILNEEQKLNFLSNLQTAYENQHVIYLFNYFTSLNQSKINVQNMKIYALCLVKLTYELKNENPHLITKILSHQKNHLQDILYITEFHVAFLQCCIMSYNYKMGYKFLKSQIFLKGDLDKKNYIMIEYFYFAGLIANAQQDYDEALRCYKFAHKFQTQHQSLFALEAQKMESLLYFRLGLELKAWTNPYNQEIVIKLQSVLENKGMRDRNIDLNDQDVQICIKEWLAQAQLYNFLQKEQELHSKVHFNLIIKHFEFNELNLIDLLLSINNIHNMFFINEENHYIEFKYDKLTYKDINNRLEKKFNLLKSLTNSI